MREPDYGDDYRALYALEAELSDGPPERFELLSIWRLARDPAYAAWAREIGTTACQISFFGVGATQDWGYGRGGAHDDCLRATEALLAAGDPAAVAALSHPAVAARSGGGAGTGGGTTPGRALRGSGRAIRPVHAPAGTGRRGSADRGSAADGGRGRAGVPADLLAASRRYLGRERLWATEGALWREIVTRPPRYPHTYAPPEKLCFYVLANWDVYTNVGTLEPGWRLGNLRAESAAALMARYEADDLPGLRAIYGLPAAELARRYGDPDGTAAVQLGGRSAGPVSRAVPGRHVIERAEG